MQFQNFQKYLMVFYVMKTIYFSIAYEDFFIESCKSIQNISGIFHIVFIFYSNQLLLLSENLQIFFTKYNKGCSYRHQKSIFKTKAFQES